MERDGAHTRCCSSSKAMHSLTGAAGSTQGGRVQGHPIERKWPLKWDRFLKCLGRRNIRTARINFLRPYCVPGTLPRP